MIKSSHLFFLLVFILSSCHSQSDIDSSVFLAENKSTNPDKVEIYYEENGDCTAISRSLGSVSKGSLIDGCLVPFSGINFLYFDTISYLKGRAYTHSLVLSTVLNTYKELELKSEINYRLMECSNKCGGKMFPHRTHQNGLSIDFMMPLIKNGERYTKLDNIGAEHYFLEFNSKGELIKDTTIKVDFNEVAKHILTLEENARKNKLRIKKVIIKISFKEELFKTEYGKKLKASGIYVVRNLSSLIDSLHDDHYHVDFEKTL